MLPRLNLQTVGKWVAQFFMPVDLVTGAAYTEKTRPLLHGARFEWVLDSDGIPVLQTVADTVGPVYGLFPWPPKSPRKLAQLSFCFPAKITSVSGATYNATPVQTGATTGWTSVDEDDDDLGEMRVYTKDGVAPAVGDFGLVVIGTEMEDQKPLFFQGGGGGSSDTTYQVTENNADGTYTLQAYDYKEGATVDDPVEACEELNLAISVPVGTWVRGFMEADDVIRFSLPLGCPAP